MGSYYVGQTNDVERREKEHNGQGWFEGAKYTMRRRPVELVHQEDYQTRAFAMQREKELKKLSHQQKFELINCLAIH